MKSETNCGNEKIIVVFVFISLALTVISRVASVFYSMTATDIEYMSTALPAFCKYLASILSSSATAVMYASIIYAAYYPGKRTRGISLLAAVAVAVADQLSAFFIDLIGGDIAGGEVSVFLWDIAMAAAASALVLTVWIIAGKCARTYIANKMSATANKGSSPYSALALGLSAVLLICLVLELVNIILFFIECNWYVRPEETVSMLVEILEMILYRFVLPLVVGSASLFAVMKRKDIKQ